jgi:hypothetical protein
LHQFIPSRLTELTGEDLPGLAPLWTVPAQIAVLPEAMNRCEHPPPELSPPRSRGLIGIVILMV